MLNQLKKEILEANMPAGLNVRLVAIDGHGGSGKSTLAKYLAEQLNAEIVHTDDFASFDKPMDWWARLVKDVLEPIKRGDKALNYERGAWYKNHSPKPVENQLVTPTLLLEGVSSSRVEFRHYLAYSIWVDTPLEECRRRGIARDLADNTAGKTIDDLEYDWNKWHKYELEYVARDNPRSYVNKIVDGTSKIE